MNSNTLSKLEFNIIKENLSNYCATYIGKSLALNLTPYHDSSIVKTKLSETDEAINLIYQNSTPSLNEIANITIYIKTLETRIFFKSKSSFRFSQYLQIIKQSKRIF